MRHQMNMRVILLYDTQLLNLRGYVRSFVSNNYLRIKKLHQVKSLKNQNQMKYLEIYHHIKKMMNQ